MCLSAPGNFVPPELILGMREQGKGNIDGVGIMYPLNGVMVTDKLVGGTKTEIANLWIKHQKVALEHNVPIALHHRRKTVGPIDLENCQPFPLCTQEDGSELDIWMMHNGTLDDVQVQKTHSDSWNYAKLFLGPYLKKHPDAMSDSTFWMLVQANIGTNKLIVMSSKGDVVIVNSAVGRFLTPQLWGSKKDAIKLVEYLPSTVTTSTVPAVANPPVLHLTPPDPRGEVDLAEFVWVENNDGYFHLANVNSVDVCGGDSCQT